MEKNYTKVYIEAENFRDKAWGEFPINRKYDLVLEMTEGYSDLYISLKGKRTPIGDMIFMEEPTRSAINEYCRKKYGIEFVSSRW